jgi:alpha-galactosidase
LRSDFIFDPVGNQGHTYGLSFWLPYHGTGARHLDEYALRSALACPHFIACWDLRDRTLDYEFLRRILGEWRQYADHYLGDYYPLTPYTTANDAWMAWQFDRPEQGRGVVQAFRRAESFYEVARFRLHGLEPNARYRVTTLGSANSSTELSGGELMQTGLRVEASAAPTAVVMVYERL